MAVLRILGLALCLTSNLVPFACAEDKPEMVVSDGDGDDPLDGTGAENEEEEEEVATELITETARMFQNAVRSGDVKSVVKVMKSFAAGNSPKTLAKILNWQDAVGASSLHWCAFYGTEVHAALTKTFTHVEGIDSSLLDKQNRSACHTACARGSVAVLEKLMDPEKKTSKSCDPLSIDGTGLSCLHYAARRNDMKMLELLKPLITEDNVDMYTKLSHPETPLFMAVEEASAEVAEALIKLGAKGSKGRLVDDGKREEKAVTLANEKLASYKAIGAAIQGSSSSQDGKKAEL
eukprot:TRINITY_DN75405_c0_g1_i1.p1 TRINITY_DN75405_c0_g1~~TRINITY_DN75405_c0_g1_i1.p1  ORF type:complete len:292 (-),score=76.65 TRINITY_DN75405_c0_g1_i1:25-900(-)